jgi:SAM-dependent methyltransferase
MSASPPPDLPPGRSLARGAKALLRPHAGLLVRVCTPIHKVLVTPAKARFNSRRKHRCLEIGPGAKRLPGFETLNVVAGWGIDYVADAARRLPFADASFDLIHASHVLEHIPWYLTQEVLNEWARVLKPGGALEIWVPDGLKIAKAFVNAEEGLPHGIPSDGWYRFNPDRDPCLWANGRVFSYGDGTGRKGHPNWHLALFSPRHLRTSMQRAGLTRIAKLDEGDVRGHDHGWINLGFRGEKA